MEARYERTLPTLKGSQWAHLIEEYHDTREGSGKTVRRKLFHSGGMGVGMGRQEGDSKVTQRKRQRDTACGS
jgi:hypothetical protein